MVYLIYTCAVSAFRGLLPPSSMTPEGIQKNGCIDIKDSEAHKLILALQNRATYGYLLKVAPTTPLFR